MHTVVAMIRRSGLTGLLLVLLAASLACVPLPQAPATPAPATGGTAAAPARPTLTQEPAPIPASLDRSAAVARIQADVDVLAGQIGPRVAGTPEERAGAEYVAAQFRAAGLEPRIEPFDVTLSQDRGATITAGGRTIEAASIARSLPGNAEGPLVVAGLGRPDEFPAGTRGAIVLVERGIISFEQKARNAAAAGAVGIIVYNNEPGAVQATFAQTPPVPGAIVLREEGRALAASAGQLATLSVRIESVTLTSWNVIADTRPGLPATVVVGGHMDSVPGSPGANDNASGTAMVLELARQARDRQDPFNIRFMAFGAEELGLLGSQHYVRTLPEAERQAMRAMLNFDMVGVGDRFRIGGDEPLASQARAAAGSAGITAIDFPQGRGGSDHAPFSAAGIPALFFHVTDDPDYHLPTDVPGNLRPGILGQVLDAALLTLDLLGRS